MRFRLSERQIHMGLANGIARTHRHRGTPDAYCLIPLPVSLLVLQRQSRLSFPGHEGLAWNMTAAGWHYKVDWEGGILLQQRRIV